MKREEVIAQMEINKELSILGNLHEYLSYKEQTPDKRFFVAGDNSFTRKARLLQSIRRWQTGAKEGFREYKGIKTFHGNLAADGDRSGVNFLHKEIFNYAKKRIADKKPYETIEEDRMMNNFLSSQPMAFNLFYPLMVLTECEEGLRGVANVLNALLKDTVSIDVVEEVGLEFIPDYYTDCLNDRTAMDAYVRFITKDGKRGIVAIETKYTDCLGKNEASNPEPARAAVLRDGIKYLFKSEAVDKIQSGAIRLNQVYRNFLLTECVRLHEGLDYSYSIVLAPKENESNKEDEKDLVSILAEVSKNKFQVITLEDFVGELIKEFPDEDIFKRFQHRYLDFRTAEWLLRNYLSHK